MVKNIGILGLFIAAAIVLTWPLTLYLGTHLPLGSESVATVPLFNLWTLQWNALQLFSGYPNYWDAPTFFPNAGSFALSEAMPVTGIIFSAFFSITRNQVAAYNLVLLLGLALNGFSAYLLSRQLSVLQMPALLTGILALSMPFVGREMGVLQLALLWPVLLTLAALARFRMKRDLISAMGLGLWAAVSMLTSSQYGLFLSMFLILAGVVFFSREYLTRKTLLNLAAGIAIGAILVLPIVMQQRQLLEAYTRSKSTITNLSAEPLDYLRLDRQSWGASSMPWLRDVGGSGQRLYPGTGLVVLAGLGALAAWKGGRQRWALYCVLGAGLAFGFSLGFNLSIGDWQPYEWLYRYYPGFMQLRSPFRLGVFVQVFFVGLAGYGVAWLWRWKGKWGSVLAMLLLVFSMGEVSTLPARLAEYPKEQVEASWVVWMAEQPEGAVIHLPISKSTKAAAFEETVIQMLQGLEHGHALANGYSGFSPRSYQQLKPDLLLFPSERSMQVLAEMGIRYVVVSPGWIDERQEAGIGADMKSLRLVYSDGDVKIYWID